MLSRVADTLYWMSRYLERAEHTARVVDVNLHLMLDQSPAAAGPRWERVLAGLRIPSPPGGLDGDPYAIVRALTFDQSNPSSIVSSIAAARENARQARELVSSEMWEQLNRLFLQVRRAGADASWLDQPHDFFLSVMEGAYLFQGIADSTIGHGECWQFIELGRYLERAGAGAALIDVHLGSLVNLSDPTLLTDNHLEWVGLLKSFTAFEAYCKVYMADMHPDRIAEFLLLDAEFPHSIRFSADRVQATLAAIAESTGSNKADRLDRLAGRLKATLSFGLIDEILSSGLRNYLYDIQRQCTQIHSGIHQFYIAYPVEFALDV